MVSGERLTFAIAVDHNRYLRVGSRVLEAILEIRAEPVPLADSELPLAGEVIIIDTSISMLAGSRIAAAREAAAAAVTALRDGSYFAVIGGHSVADMIYPAGPVMAQADDHSRAEACRAIGRLSAEGKTTNMSAWLALADTLLAGCPAEIRHAVLLTDGKCTGGSEALTATLAACAGHFACDCRGVGEAYREDELREITDALGGEWAPVAAPEKLADDFRAALAKAMARRVPQVALRITPSRQARIGRLARVVPRFRELTGKGTADGRGQAFALGDWGEETQAYYLRLEASQDDLRIETGTPVRAAIAEVVVPALGQRDSGTVAAATTVTAAWTDDEDLWAPVNPQVARYTGQTELAAAVTDGLRLWRRGAAGPAAEAAMGRAARLAHELEREDLLELFSAIAKDMDPVRGKIQLSRYEDVSKADMIWAAYLSEYSRSVRPDPEDGAVPRGADG
jgi:hypothetical protein